MVNQPELELQLKVWKELAISKQMLMRAATDALKLDPNCSQDELKEALEGVLKKLAKADSDVASAREQARTSITAMERKMTATEQALTSAQATVAELQKTQEAATRQMATDRTVAAREAQKLKDRIAEQDKALKAINTALSDTPENVIKKMNLLKKQKLEEAETRRSLEASLHTLRNEKREQDQKLSETRDRTTKLVTQYRDLHAVCAKLHEQLKGASVEGEIPALPELDAKLLEEIEQPEGEAGKTASANGNSNGKQGNGPKSKKK